MSFQMEFPKTSSLNDAVDELFDEKMVTAYEYEYTNTMQYSIPMNTEYFDSHINEWMEYFYNKGIANKLSDYDV